MLGGEQRRGKFGAERLERDEWVSSTTAEMSRTSRGGGEKVMGQENISKGER